jgi:hypothetical protein
MANKAGFDGMISGPNKVGSTFASNEQQGGPEGGTAYKGGCSQCGAMTPHSHSSGKGTKGGSGMTRSFGEERYRPVKGR